MAEDKNKFRAQSWSESNKESESVTKQESQTSNVLDQELLRQILSGLPAQMSEAEIGEYAEQLLRPQLNAGLEAAEQSYQTTKQAKEQEKADLAASLARAILEQQNAYRQSAAGVETAALSRGMGRSSYTLDTLANQGNALAQVIRQLTDENTRQQGQLQDQITLAAQQSAQTQGRLRTDYASQLAAKVQELRQAQQDRYNSNYMTAVSASMGSKSTNNSTTTGSSSSLNLSGTVEGIEDYKGGAGTSSGTKKPNGTLVSVKQDVLT